MFTASGSPAAASSLPAWNILFAREPEPDLELDETTADLEETAPLDDDGGDSQGPDNDKKPKMIKMALLILAAGAGLYLAMDPSIVMGPSEMPPPASVPADPKAAQAPAAAPPTSVAPPPEAQAPSPAQAPQAMPSTPVAPTPAQPKSPMPAMASAPSPSPTMPNAMPPAPPKPASTDSAGLSPLFSEGQQVVVLADQAKPNGPVALMADAGSSRPGPTVAANAMATVMDGELRNDSWVYAIRTPQGATGWISEKQLQPKP